MATPHGAVEMVGEPPLPPDPAQGRLKPPPPNTDLVKGCEATGELLLAALGPAAGDDDDDEYDEDAAAREED